MLNSIKHFFSFSNKLLIGIQENLIYKKVYNLNDQSVNLKNCSLCRILMARSRPDLIPYRNTRWCNFF